MMKHRIVKLSVKQTGKMLATLYGFLCLIALPFMLIALIAGSKSVGPTFILLLLYPIFGFVGGVILAAVYNLVSKFVGGLEVCVETVE